MFSKVQNAINWRINFVRLQFLGLIWEVKQLLDFSKKEKVNGISVIVVGRNDNYGGDFTKRLQTILDLNLGQLPNAELIYVEWNTISEKPSDCKWISERYKNSKCYIVPKEIHNSIAHNPKKMKVMEYFGKNVGIRRASFDWIVLVNADVLMGTDMVKSVEYLNKDSIYGGHYVNIVWDGRPITAAAINNKNIVKASFSAYDGFSSTVGNFILTHKKNWLNATGYDENLNGSRAGVDANGYLQLKGKGLKTKVIGHHFHLDHPESIINNTVQDNHGDRSQMTNNKNIPYKNKESWGLINYPLKQISERIWELQPI